MTRVVVVLDPSVPFREAFRFWVILGLVFARHTLWPGGRPDLLAPALAGTALVALRRYPSAVAWVVLAGGVLGLLLRGGP